MDKIKYVVFTEKSIWLLGKNQYTNRPAPLIDSIKGYSIKQVVGRSNLGI